MIVKHYVPYEVEPAANGVEFDSNLLTGINQRHPIQRNYPRLNIINVIDSCRAEIAEIIENTLKRQ